MPAIEKELRRSILDAQKIIQEACEADCNEAETRRRIERIFETVMGYDAFKNLSRERAVKGAGETEYVDFAVHLEGPKSKPEIMVEIKRASVDLELKHLKQVASYSIDAGCEWIILTNSREWRLYHVSFGQPPITKLIHSWNMLTDDLPALAESFDLICLKSLRKGFLESVWQKSNVLDPRNVLQIILSPLPLGVIRRELRKEFGVSLSPEEVVSGIRRLLNENAVSELEGIRISLGEKKTKKRRARESSSIEGQGVQISEAAEEQSPAEPTQLKE